MILLLVLEYGIVAKETVEAMNCFDKIYFFGDNNGFITGKFEEYYYIIVILVHPKA